MTLIVEFDDGRPECSDWDLVLNRPRVLRAGTARYSGHSWEVTNWGFSGDRETPSFTLWELCRIEYLIERGELEQGPHGLRFARARVDRDLAEVAAWAGMDKDQALRAARARAAEARMGTAPGEARNKARDLRLRARKSPHGKLAHLTRQADKLDAQARKAALIARKRGAAPELLAMMRSLAEPAS